MSKTNGVNKKTESIKALISIEDNEPYVKLMFQPSAGTLGFEVKQKSYEECSRIADEVIKKYSHMIQIKEPKVNKNTGEVESFI